MDAEEADAVEKEEELAVLVNIGGLAGSGMNQYTVPMIASTNPIRMLASIQ